MQVQSEDVHYGIIIHKLKPTKVLKQTPSFWCSTQTVIVLMPVCLGCTLLVQQTIFNWCSLCCPAIQCNFYNGIRKPLNPSPKGLLEKITFDQYEIATDYLLGYPIVRCLVEKLLINFYTHT